MKKTIAKILTVGLLCTPLMGLASDKEDNLLTIVTSDDSLTQLMALVLSTQAKKQGANVEVLFCGKAGSLVVKGTKEVKLKPKNISPNKLVEGLIKIGANVGVCPPYLPNNGVKKSDLIEGVKVVKPPKVAQRMMREDTKILSY